MTEIERLEREVLEARRNLEDAQIDIKQCLAVTYVIGGVWLGVILAGILVEPFLFAFIGVPLVLTCAILHAIDDDNPWTLQRKARRALEDVEIELNKAYMGGSV